MIKLKTPNLNALTYHAVKCMILVKMLKALSPNQCGMDVPKAGNVIEGGDSPLPLKKGRYEPKVQSLRGIICQWDIDATLY